ncbi:MAG: hypothetical protein OEZ06_07170 [Myxococcales bacterium]|nr:hypothetical protein [Myxococcales bacterium]
METERGVLGSVGGLLGPALVALVLSSCSLLTDFDHYQYGSGAEDGGGGGGAATDDAGAGSSMDGGPDADTAPGDATDAMTDAMIDAGPSTDGDVGGGEDSGGDSCKDSDGDGVCDANDVCPDGADSADADADGVPDACDRCDGSDDSVDADADSVPDGCDACQGHDDRVDSDSDGVPDGCDCDQGSEACDVNASCNETATGTSCNCNAGYTGDGSSCSAVDCGALSPPTNGHVGTPAGTTYGQEASYACDLGYALSGDASRRCESDGTWSGGAPSCPVSGCGPPPLPVGGSVSGDSTAAGSTVKYSCDGGLRLNGSQFAVCGPDGVGGWLGEPPLCGQVGECACDGAYAVGDAVMADWDILDGLGSLVLPAGARGRVVTVDPLEPGVLVEWEDWFDGYDGLCDTVTSDTCPPCIPAGTSRWWVYCDDLVPLRLTCSCGGSLSTGDRVVALVDAPAPAPGAPKANGVTQGQLGTVIAGGSGANNVLVEWDGWTNGHGGDCGSSRCGGCEEKGLSRWYTACDQLGWLPPP